MCSAAPAQAYGCAGAYETGRLCRLGTLDRAVVLTARAPDFERTPRRLACTLRVTRAGRRKAIFVRRFCNRQLGQRVPGLILGFHDRALNLWTLRSSGRGF